MDTDCWRGGAAILFSHNNPVRDVARAPIPESPVPGGEEVDNTGPEAMMETTPNTDFRCGWPIGDTAGADLCGG